MYIYGYLSSASNVFDLLLLFFVPPSIHHLLILDNKSISTFKNKINHQCTNMCSGGVGVTVCG